MIGMTESVKIGDQHVASIILGQSPPSTSYNSAGKGVPFFQGKADFGLLHPIPRVWCTEGKKFATPGDILISVRAPVGDVNVATDECVIGRGISAIRAGSRSDPWFLYFALLYTKPTLESRATGSTFASVNKGTLSDLDIPFPDRLDQVEIGRFLRGLVARLEKEEAALSIARNLKRATMRQLFARGLRNEAQKETEIGSMPESWEAESISELTNVVYRYPSYYKIDYVDFGVPEVRGELLKDGGEIESDLSLFRFIDDETAARFPKVRLETGDIVMSVRGTMGKIGIARDIHAGAVITANLIRLAPKRQRILPEFFKSVLISERFNRALEMASPQTTIKTITAPVLKSLRVPTPATLEEQREIVAIFDAIDRKVDLHRKKRAVLDDLFKVLLHKLMTGEIHIADLTLDAIGTNVDDDSEGNDQTQL